MKAVQTNGQRKFILKRQKGYSMVEIGLALVIITLLGVGTITYFSNNTSAAQANQLGNDLSTLMGKVKGSYSGNYSAVTNAKLDTGGFFSALPSLNNNAGVVSTNLGGGTLTVSPGTVTTANDSVKYVITQMPDASCLPIVTALSKTATTLSIGANVVKAAGAKPDPSKVTCTNDNTTMTVQVQ
jgi:type II secretory pathway pseudopilin PulG